MRFEAILPTARLRPYVKRLVLSEMESAQSYKVFPSTGMVTGFQYRGSLSVWQDNKPVPLSSAGISGLSDAFRVFENTAGIGTILVYFTETGISHFTDTPAHELFNQSLSLEHIFDRDKVTRTEEKLSVAHSDSQRISIIETFLLSELKERDTDKLIVEAIKRICSSGGAIRIRDLGKQLWISQSPFEKRFRKVVGTSPKKFASIVRFNTVLGQFGSGKSLSDICYENNFFDQAHFIKDFKRYTGDTPETFKRGL